MKTAQRVFFPWEEKRGLLRFLSGLRILPTAGAVLLVVLIVWIWRREEQASGVRASRAAITTVWHAVRAYRADHGGECPKAASDLVLWGYLRRLPLDGWGRAIRLTCPAPGRPGEFQVTSDGPDGIPGGLDRVE